MPRLRDLLSLIDRRALAVTRDRLTSTPPTIEQRMGAAAPAPQLAPRPLDRDDVPMLSALRALRSESAR